jgi:serine protease
MKTARISGVLPPLLLVGAVLGAAWLWHGPPTRDTTAKAPPAAADQAGAEAVDPAVLVVDFRDDVDDAYLASTPEDERPRLRADPRVESVDWDIAASIPPDEQEQADQAALREAASEQRALLAECAVAVKDGGDDAAAPSDPCYRYQWHLRQVGMPTAWALAKGEGAVVAVIDTGVSRVPDLAGTKMVPGYNFVADNADASDDHGHGTHVAGTIAQTTHNKLGVGGVAYKASIMPLKVLSASGSGSMAAIAQAIRFAADNGAHVINMSLGGPFPVGAIGSAVKYARSKGVTVVAAAGNDGRGRVSYPARYPGVIAVAATQFDESTTFYSNWGPQIDIAGPGGNTRVDQNGDGQPDGVLQNTVVPRNVSNTDYLWFMGTSMAAPHVAGVAALVVSAGVTKPDAVEEILLDTARKPKKQGKPGSGASEARVDDHYGAGLVDAHAAVKKVRGARGAGELGLGAALALLGVSFLARRGKVSGKVGPGFAAALVAGSSGLFFLPLIFPSLGTGVTAGVTAALSSGVLDGADGMFGRAFGGNPLLWSALIPVGLTALLYGSGRLRPALAGLGFGVAGALLFAAVAGSFDVRYIPDLLDRAWLITHAALAAIVATNVLRR